MRCSARRGNRATHESAAHPNGTPRSEGRPTTGLLAAKVRYLRHRGLNFLDKWQDYRVVIGPVAMCNNGRL